MEEGSHFQNMVKNESQLVTGIQASREPLPNSSKKILSTHTDRHRDIINQHFIADLSLKEQKIFRFDQIESIRKQ